jgi:tetratricopeptide (TPR) repeat protein
MDRILAIAQRIRKDDSLNVDAPFLEGYAHLHKKEFTLALASFDATLELDSTVYDCYSQLHWIYSMPLNATAKAAEVRKRARRVYKYLWAADSLNARLNFLLAESYAMSDYRTETEIKLAKRYYDAAARLDSNNARYLFESYWIEKDLTQESFHKLERALQLDENWNYRSHYCMALNKLKRYEDAVLACTVGLVNYPWDKRYYQFRAEAYKGIGDTVRQQEDLKACKRLSN